MALFLTIANWIRFSLLAILYGYGDHAMGRAARRILRMAAYGRGSIRQF